MEQEDLGSIPSLSNCYLTPRILGSKGKTPTRPADLKLFSISTLEKK